MSKKGNNNKLIKNNENLKHDSWNFFCKSLLQSPNLLQGICISWQAIEQYKTQNLRKVSSKR